MTADAPDAPAFFAPFAELMAGRGGETRPDRYVLEINRAEGDENSPNVQMSLRYERDYYRDAPQAAWALTVSLDFEPDQVPATDGVAQARALADRLRFAADWIEGTKTPSRAEIEAGKAAADFRNVHQARINSVISSLRFWEARKDSAPYLLVKDAMAVIALLAAHPVWVPAARKHLLGHDVPSWAQSFGAPSQGAGGPATRHDQDLTDGAIEAIRERLGEIGRTVPFIDDAVAVALHEAGLAGERRGRLAAVAQGITDASDAGRLNVISLDGLSLEERLAFLQSRTISEAMKAAGGLALEKAMFEDQVALIFDAAEACFRAMLMVQQAEASIAKSGGT